MPSFDIVSIFIVNEDPSCPSTTVENQVSFSSCSETYIVRISAQSNAAGPFSVYTGATSGTPVFSAVSRTDLVAGQSLLLYNADQTGCATPTPTPTQTVTPTPSVTASLTPTPTSSPIIPTVTPTPTPSITPSSTVTPTVTPTPSNTPSVTPSITPSVTPSITVSPSVTPTVTPTSSITPTPSITPTITPTSSITPTPSITPSITPTITPSITPTITPTSSITPTPSITPTLTPTPSITPTLTPTLTPTTTPTPTPTPAPLEALIFMESGDDAVFSGDENTDIGDWMVNQGAVNWNGFQISGMPTFPTDVNDFLIWMDWPGFYTGTTNVPPVIKASIPQSGGGTDAYGNSIDAYKFVTTEITGGTTTGNIHYVVVVPLVMTNNQIYTDIGINYDNSPSTLTATSTDSGVRGSNVVYSGSNWTNATYRVYTNSPVTGGFDIGVSSSTDSTNNYFRGGTLA